jgi:hypothetical protein
MEMKILSATRTQLVLKPSRKDENWKAFIFDIGIIPDKPTPQKIVIQKKVGAYMLSWSMPWRKFLRQTAIDTVVILEKSELDYKSVKQKMHPTSGGLSAADELSKLATTGG